MSLYADLCRQLGNAREHDRKESDSATAFVTWLLKSFRKHLGCTDEVCYLGRKGKDGATVRVNAAEAAVHHPEEGWSTTVLLEIHAPNEKPLTVKWVLALEPRTVDHDEGWEVRLANGRGFAVVPDDAVPKERDELFRCMLRETSDALKR